MCRGKDVCLQARWILLNNKARYEAIRLDIYGFDILFKDMFYQQPKFILNAKMIHRALEERLKRNCPVSSMNTR